MDPIRKDRWPLGVNNVTKASRVPEGAVRDMVNLDPGVDGVLSLRAGYSQVMECEAARAAFAVGDYVIVVDGPDVRALHPDTGSLEVIGQVADEAPVTGTQLNGQLYLSTAVGSHRTDGVFFKPWAVPQPGFQVELLQGGTLVGRHQVAVVAVGADGEESGADPILIDAPAGSAIRLTSTDTRVLRVYASVANGATLYYQGLILGGAMALTAVDDSREYLTTSGLKPMPHCEQLVAHHSVLLGRSGRYVFFTAPMYPHLTDPVRGFFQYPEPVRLLAATDGGVYIVADKTYFVTALETPTPIQRVVLEIDAVAGTQVSLPDGRAAWFTRYGQAVGSPTGEVQLVNRQSFAPAVAAAGAAGWLGHNGNEMVVTAMRGATDTNNLATGDFADLEIG